MKKTIFFIAIFCLLNKNLCHETVCGKTEISGETFYQGQFINALNERLHWKYYFQLYPSVQSSRVPLLLYLAGDFGNGSVIRAFDYAGPQLWDNNTKTFYKNANSLNQNNHLLFIDFPCGYGFHYEKCDEPLGTLDDLADTQVASMIQFVEIRDHGKDGCDMTQFQSTDQIIMTDGFGASLAMLLADKLKKDAKIKGRNNKISLIMSDPVFELRENFSSLDAYLEARGNFASLSASKTLTSMQTKFILTKNVKNQDIKELVNAMNNCGSRNIYDVTNSQKQIINSNKDYNIFDPVPLAKEDQTLLIRALMDNIKGSSKTLEYNGDTDVLLRGLQLTIDQPLIKLKNLQNDNVEILILQSQNNAIFNTLGLLKLYSRSNIPDLEAIMYSENNTNLFNQYKQSKCTVYQNSQGNFTHVQIMQVGYWMAKQAPDVINKLIKMFIEKDLLNKSWTNFSRKLIFALSNTIFYFSYLFIDLIQ